MTHKVNRRHLLGASAALVGAGPLLSRTGNDYRKLLKAKNCPEAEQHPKPEYEQDASRSGKR